MRFKVLAVIVILLTQGTMAQVSYKSNYSDLKSYDGEYEYTNNSTIILAASPRDTVLYALIADGRYPLKQIAKDRFIDNAKSNVTFQRDERGHVAGYDVDGRHFRILKPISLNRNIWYPRQEAGNTPFRYKYKRPLLSGDGIVVADMESSGADMLLITDMMNKIVDGTYPNIHSILVLKNNKLVLEEYFYEYDVNTRHQLRSATKSFFSALAGIAIDKGLIKSKNDPVLPYFPEYQLQNNPASKTNITIENLLTNQTGLDCDISNEKSEGNETVMSNSDDWVKFTMDLPMIDTPGGKGRYCSGNPIILGRIIEKAASQSLVDFAKTHLFGPLGISNYKWHFKPDKSSAETFCQLYLRPRDMAKFGLLYMNNGTWKGKQIVPSAWVKESLAKHSVINGTDYGYLWWLQWLNVGGKRYDGIAAKGNGGQRIYLFPKQQIVAVITGGSFNIQSSSDNLLINNVLPALEKMTPY